MEYIFAIDPGNEESAYVLMEVDTLYPVTFGKVYNEFILDILEKKIQLNEGDYIHFAIEMIGHYGTGMPAGKTVFDTCVWIGMFRYCIMTQFNRVPTYIMRKDEKINLCGNMKAKDSNIRQALIDRFGVVGTKKNKGWFYGFKADIWQAYAVGITYHDLFIVKDRNASLRG